MIRFDCKYSSSKGTQTWKGYVSRLTYFGSHLEMKVVGKCDITVILGNTSSGYFVYFSRFETGINISNAGKTLENMSSMMSILGDEEAVTVAYALTTVSQLVGGGQKPCKRNLKSTKMIPY